jgi:hypothetical protein
MMASQTPKALVKKLALSVGLMGAGLLLVPILQPSSAQASPDERLPGTFVCQNNQYVLEGTQPGPNDPQPQSGCGNPHRVTTGDWRCIHNTGPECNKDQPPLVSRIEGELTPGGWKCKNNQNVVSCKNPIRYSVQNPDRWSSYFPPNSGGKY